MSGYYSDNDHAEDDEDCCEGDDEDERKNATGHPKKRAKNIPWKFRKDTDECTSSGAAFSSSGNLWFLSHRIAKSDFE